MKILFCIYQKIKNANWWKNKLEIRYLFIIDASASCSLAPSGFQTLPVSITVIFTVGIFWSAGVGWVSPAFVIAIVGVFRWSCSSLAPALCRTRPLTITMTVVVALTSVYFLIEIIPSVFLFLDEVKSWDGSHSD